MLYNEHNLSVAKIADKSDRRPELAGVFFKPDRTAATDTFRLLEVSTPADVKPEDFPIVPPNKTAMRGFKPFIIPAKAVQEIAKMKRGKNSTLPVLDHVAISRVDENQVEFISTNLEIGDSKLIRRTEGTFPEYEALFPSGEPKLEIEINAKLLAELLKIMSRFNKLQSVKIKLYGNQSPIALYAESQTQKARGLIMGLKP